jgi:hypothetical protein
MTLSSDKSRLDELLTEQTLHAVRTATATATSEVHMRSFAERELPAETADPELCRLRR